MAQEFIINSSTIEDKINQLLPSQGGFGAGVDFSASTMVIPIVDLTESAEGSGLRVDLQSAISHDTATTFDVAGSLTTIVNTTGYWRIIGTINHSQNSGGAESCSIILNDGATSKTIYKSNGLAIGSGTSNNLIPIDFIVFLSAGDSLQMTSTNTSNFLSGSVRQLADISGNLVNP